MSATPVLLAIEASQRRGGVAVRDRDGEDHVEWLGESARHDDDLLAAVDRLFGRLRLAPADTGVVGVSTGPGGFTGLRVAVATAKMLAESLCDTLTRQLSQLVVGHQGMDLAGVVRDQPGGTRQHPVTQVHAVDEHLAVDDLVENHVMVARRAQVGKPDDFLEVLGVVMQVAGRQQPATRGQVDRGPGTVR